MFSYLLSFLLLLSLGLLRAAAASTVVLYVQPHSETSSTPSPPISLVQVEYDADKSTASVVSYTPPTSLPSSQPYLRIGLFDPGSEHWRGIVTDATSFTDQYKKKFILHVDDNGQVYHLGLSTDVRTNKENNAEVEVELVQRGVGPKPTLNVPVKLNAEGKLGSTEPEKTFLQKYWWALALFLAVQFFAGGEK